MIELFLRDDDVDSEKESLHRLIGVALKWHVPISFGVIPASLTKEARHLLNSVKSSHPDLIELHQHGWKHANHEGATGKGEFGPKRSYDQQLDDLRRGRDTLEQAFGGNFFPAFSPPWNIYTVDTTRAMRELGFSVLSAGVPYVVPCGHNIQNYPVMLDILNWCYPTTLEYSRAIFLYMFAKLGNLPRPVGLLLHHMEMTAETFELLETQLERLWETEQVVFHTFETLEGKRIRSEEAEKHPNKT